MENPFLPFAPAHFRRKPEPVPRTEVVSRTYANVLLSSYHRIIVIILSLLHYHRVIVIIISIIIILQIKIIINIHFAQYELEAELRAPGRLADRRNNNI